MSPAVKRAIRTFVQSFLGGVISMLTLQGLDVIPDLSVLRRVVVSGIVAGTIGLLTLAQNSLEDKQVINPKWVLKEGS